MLKLNDLEGDGAGESCLTFGWSGGSFSLLDLGNLRLVLCFVERDLERRFRIDKVVLCFMFVFFLSSQFAETQKEMGREREKDEFECS